MKPEPWIGGNQLQLLENGEEYFPAVFGAISSARHEVLIETFILFEDKVGLALHAVLVAAARRGVRVDLTVDGFGSPALSSAFVDELTAAGVRLHVFDPPPRLSRRLQPFRRLHRKIVVVDGEVGFVGGLNYSADHLADYGPQAKQDYAVMARGPVVEPLRRAAYQLIDRHAPPSPMPHPAATGSAQAQVVIRDNQKHRDDIERIYRRALHAAQREVIIANAYFFPGYRLLKSLQRAARRGVQVRLILQGQAADTAWATFAARMVYDRLIEAGVRIYEYCERPMHGKVALVDDEWSTIGSSNLDPLSLSLNLEANLVIRDRDLNAQLRQKLTPLMQQQCQRVRIEQTAARRWWWRLGVGYLVFHAMRHFPRWAANLPPHRPRVVPAADSTLVVAAPAGEAVQAWQWQADAAPAAAGGLGP
ncbi:cardiolipin synthase ClsB [Aquabacterium sp.]|uniref:cardiolipin synthase ClsB n=1 Tax=Aquabacterium sp. TaxID=1872578 RepID=UPI002BB9BB35|nr:cardiolipin synthase ClsB [Aquabacterium sp.]HSW09270.1 cardiolipin synthase ClsB [Aquabacterium sp.]